MIVPSGLELGCLWPEGVTPIRCRINISTKKLRKRCKVTFRISSGKFQKSLLSQNNLWHPVVQPFPHPHHLRQPCYTFPYVFLRIFQVHVLFTRHLPRDHSISCPRQDLERTINKLFTGLIGLRYVTTSREVTYQS